MTSELDWRRAAACVNLPQRYVFTRSASDAKHALRACNKCPIRRECEAVVDPAHTWFDGVSGGRLWRNGRVVAV
ncbi:WhiB family transcriptional regulator [Streptomyces sp. NPDC046805]|uniref:WhiB family transcriptional regulator n=1 Tax=Streptomyces sp. NPDC046805 TaxID=3155134 RepID=UPI0033D07235